MRRAGLQKFQSPGVLETPQVAAAFTSSFASSFTNDISSKPYEYLLTSSNRAYRVSQHNEIEVRYFVSGKILRGHLSLEILPFERIFQAYFPAALIPKICKQAITIHSNLRGFDPQYFVSARVRRVVHGDLLDLERTSEYFLQLKGPKQSDVSREEFSVEIPADFFKRVLPLATDGSLEKVRFIDRGHLLDRRGTRHSAEAHIDYLIDAGINLKPKNFFVPRIDKIKYCIVEVEVPKMSLLPQLRRASCHSFPYLPHSVYLNDIRGAIRNVMKNRHLARVGLKHGSVDRAVTKLLKH